MKKISEWPKWGRITFYVFVAFLVLICPLLIIPLLAWWVIRRYLRWSAENRLAESAARLESGAAPAKTPFFPKDTTSRVILVVLGLAAIGSCLNSKKDGKQAEGLEESVVEQNGEVTICGNLSDALMKQGRNPNVGDGYIVPRKTPFLIVAQNFGNGNYYCNVPRVIDGHYESYQELFYEYFIIKTSQTLVDEDSVPDGVYVFVGVGECEMVLGGKKSLRMFREVTGEGAKKAIDAYCAKREAEEKKRAEQMKVAAQEAEKRREMERAKEREAEKAREEKRKQAEAKRAAEESAAAKAKFLEDVCAKYGQVDYCNPAHIIVSKSIRGKVTVTYKAKYQKIADALKRAKTDGSWDEFYDALGDERLISEYKQNGYVKYLSSARTLFGRPACKVSLKEGETLPELFQIHYSPDSWNVPYSNMVFPNEIEDGISMREGYDSYLVLTSKNPRHTDMANVWLEAGKSVERIKSSCKDGEISSEECDRKLKAEQKKLVDFLVKLAEES